MVIAAVGLMFFLSSGLRAISLAGRYGLVEAKIPVMQVQLHDTSESNFQEKAIETLTGDTPMIVLTNKAFIFGNAQAFAQDMASVRNKFTILHDEGAPQLHRLIKDLQRWMQDRTEQSGQSAPTTVLFLPTEDIPMPVVIQCVSGLNESKIFKNVVLGGGIL